MTAPQPTQVFCITGAPRENVRVHGLPIARFDTIAHRDGSSWTYHGLKVGNRAVLCGPINRSVKPRGFSMAEFGITVIAESDQVRDGMTPLELSPKGAG